jgi:hypothetical protein
MTQSASIIPFPGYGRRSATPLNSALTQISDPLTAAIMYGSRPRVLINIITDHSRISKMVAAARGRVATKQYSPKLAIDWARWHQLVSGHIEQSLSPVERREYRRIKAILDENDRVRAQAINRHQSAVHQKEIGGIDEFIRELRRINNDEG